MKKFFATFWLNCKTLVKNFWFWFLCGTIAICNGTLQEKITVIIALTILFPLIATTMNLWIDKIRRE